ncbi:MAG: O-antigen ligase family protein [Cryobacterium sp.]|nr:O-antigen ligase family protein [Cryobacterium sp.]
MSRGQRFDVTLAFMSSARFVTVLSTATVATGALSFALRQTMGWAGLIGILGALVVLWSVVLVVRRGEIEWNGLLPISLLVFLAWAAISIFWSNYQWATLGSLAYFGAFTVLAIATALLRDTIQLVRAFGDVLRFALLASIVLEVLSGLLIDTPIRFLRITGDLDNFGPIQGVFGARNQLGIVAIIALVTFLIELRTKAIRKSVAIGSIALAALCLLFSQAPVAFGTAAILGAAAAALYGLRHTAVEHRRIWQFMLFGSGILAVVLVWVFRSPIIQLLDASNELDYRLNLWRRVWNLFPLHSIEGWGWIGSWRLELVPYLGFRNLPGGAPTSAANAYLDVLLQLGIVGLAIFLLLLSLAFTRSWLLAVQRRSVVFVWPALVLLTLLVTSLAESSILGEFFWMTLVICTVKASREMSWRQALSIAPEPPELPREK